MLNAFDTLLQTVVTADKAAANGDNEAFRYECLCCGEEVFLAAQDSIYKATHFRHRSGNNDKNCELYLGQFGSIRSSNARKNKQERVEFYYNNKTKCFYVSFNFTEEEISEYENDEVELEIRTNRKADPFFYQYINHSTFTAGIHEKFILDKYSPRYYISNTQNNQKREYSVFGSDGPSFFKILGDDPGDDEFSAKLIRSKSIYTNVRYFIAWPGRNTAQVKLNSITEAQIENEVFFKTFGNTPIWGMIISFNKKTPLLDSLLQSWGYNLDISETVCLLWPPAYEKNEKTIVSSSELYFYSTFKFQEQGNINTTKENITELSDTISKVCFQDSIHILKKNAEIEVYKKPLEFEINTIEVSKEYTDVFDVSDINEFYLFSDCGVELLSAGQKVFLTPLSFIAEYYAGSLVRLIYFSEPKDPDLEEKIIEALSSYWITEECHDIKIKSTTRFIEEYINNCNTIGSINSAAKQLLEDEKQ